MMVKVARIATCVLKLGLVFFMGTQASAGESGERHHQSDWINFNLELTAQPIVGISGGKKPSSSSWFQQLTAGLTLGRGLNKKPNTWTELDHWQLQVELNQYTGNPSLNEQLGSVYPLQDLVMPVGTWITQASIERVQGTNEIDWSMHAGVISIEDNLLNIPALDHYVNYSLDTPYNISVVGLPISPLVAPGAQVALHHHNLGIFEYGYYYLNETKELASALGVNPQMPNVQGSLHVFQWSKNPFPKYHRTTNPNQRLPDPAIALGGYISNTELDILPSENLGEGMNTAIYGAFTWPISLPIGNDNRIWISSSLSLNPSNNPLTSYAAGGLLSQGILPGRPLDILALGFNRSGFSQQLSPNKSYEGVIELNYTIQISKRLQIQPLMQWIINPSGTGSWPTIWATGAQLNVSL